MQGRRTERREKKRPQEPEGDAGGADDFSSEMQERTGITMDEKEKKLTVDNYATEELDADQLEAVTGGISLYSAPSKSERERGNEERRRYD